MKNVSGASVETHGNIEGDLIACDLDSRGALKVMGILSNMYNNKALAVLREYSTNGWDSHVEAGRTHLPIEVSLPSTLQPTLLIRDWGIGLTCEQILKVFGTYTYSTKDQSDDYVGALGIGSKSAFTLGHQFVVTGVRDGIKAVVLFMLSEDGVPSMKVVSKDVHVDERDGVLISLAVDDVRTMRDEADRFFRFWEPGRVLLDGINPDSVWDSYTRISEGIYTDKGDGAGLSVVMGQIPYRVDNSLIRGIANRWEAEGHPHAKFVKTLDSWYRTGLYAKVEIGAVDIAPSRESLRDTRKTVREIERVIEAMADGLTSSMEAECASEPDSTAAAAKFYELRKLYAPLPTPEVITYKGIELTDMLTLENWMFGLRKRSSRSVATEPWSVGPLGKPVLRAKDASKLLVVYTEHLDADRPSVQRGIRRIVEDTEFDTIMLVTKKAYRVGWLKWGGKSSVTVWDMDTFRAKLRELRQVNSEGFGRNQPSYFVGRGYFNSDSRTDLSTIINYDKPVVMYGGFAEGNWHASNVTPAERAAFADYTVVSLMSSQSSDVLAKRLDAAGIPYVKQNERAAVVAEHAATLFRKVTAKERKAWGAKLWVERNNTANHHWTRWINEFLPAESGLTNERFREQLQRVATARKLAATLSEERLVEMRQLNADPIGLHSSLLSYPGDSHEFPLLPAEYNPNERSHYLIYLNNLP